MIVKKYLKGWFTIDFISVLPSVLGYILLLMADVVVGDEKEVNRGGEANFKALKILRMLR